MPNKMHLFIRYSWLKLTGKLEDEMLYVASLLKNKRRFLDVGSNVGIYSYYFSGMFVNIEAFEPLSEIIYRLKLLNSKKVCVHNVAVSDKKGKLDFNIPIIDGKPRSELASLETREAQCEVREVNVVTIDDYEFKDVDLIKIDVEGHEENILTGAINTIKACNPVLIIEIEQRHILKDIQAVFNKIFNLGYEGFFLENGILKPLDQFSYEKNQKPYLNDASNKKYINNFIFTSIISKKKV